MILKLTMKTEHVLNVNCGPHLDYLSFDVITCKSLQISSCWSRMCSDEHEIDANLFARHARCWLAINNQFRNANLVVIIIFSLLCN